VVAKTSSFINSVIASSSGYEGLLQLQKNSENFAIRCVPEVIFQVLTVANMNMAVFWVVAP
jgi:hypothetical protein